MKPPTNPCTFGGRGCGRRIAFVTLPTGRKMPIDAEPSDDGTVAVYQDTYSGWVGRVLTADEQPDAWERRFTTHFATCTAKAEADNRAKAVKAARAAGVPVLDDKRAQRSQSARGSRGRR